MSTKGQEFLTSTHWGNYRLAVLEGKVRAVQPVAEDKEATRMGQSLLDALDPKCRIPQPMVRKGYLEEQDIRDGSKRGIDPFVPVTWDTALELAANAIDKTCKEFGNEAIYGGSYGWASAGRFHHAQSQLHRFLNCTGGYVSRRDSYSTAAAEVILPRIMGHDMYTLMFQAPQVNDIAEHCDLVVSFGGIAMKNTQVMFSGVGKHSASEQLGKLKERNIELVNISPIKDDMSDEMQADWWPCRPNSDVALMLGMAHTIVSENLHDREFLDQYCHGFEQFLPYLLGEKDGLQKDAEWAEKLSAISADRIKELARALCRQNSVISISWSLQRSEHGEQSYWMATLLAALVGQIGLPGRGIAYGYGSVHNIGFAGRHLPHFKVGSFKQGKNPVDKFIPVARISDMLLNPGQHYKYNGETLTYPDIKLIYWAGGNPFHHHQDLNRLRKAWAAPQCIIVNEPFWTATARHADIVFPTTTSLERNDLGGSSFDCYLTPMPQAVKAFADSRSDYQVFSGIAARLGLEESFTEGLDEMQWIKRIYSDTRDSAQAVGVTLPEFEEFWQGNAISVEAQVPSREFEIEKFRQDPNKNPLTTPSGKIELFSDTIASFNYADCLGHPAWYEKQEWLGAERASTFPLHMVSNQPKHKLHSQYDHSAYCRSAKTQGRTTARMHPVDAQARGLKEGDVVRIFNERGACLAGISLTERVREEVIELETGAWYDPLDPTYNQSLEVHGNPNVLTRDVGTSQLAQGSTAHSCLVEVKKYEDELPPVKVFTPPLIEITE